MREQFEVAAGTVTGRDHMRAGKNNQDAFCWAAAEDVLVAVVCDGCSEGIHSEVGAQIGARITVDSFVHVFGKGVRQGDPWEQTRLRILRRVRAIAKLMGPHMRQVIADYFLFTVVGAVVTRDLSVIFTIGDGVYAINGDVHRVGPYANNAPPYVSYALVKTDERLIDEPLLKFQVHSSEITERVESILIGTDGIAEWNELAGQRTPGKEEHVGHLGQFWVQDKYFRNPDALRRHLALVNRDISRTSRENGRMTTDRGLLPDDATLIAIRRRREEGR